MIIMIIVHVCLSACVSVGLSASISPELHAQSSPSFFSHAPHGRYLVLWQRGDKLYTSGFMDDVTFAYDSWPRIGNVETLSDSTVAARIRHQKNLLRSNTGLVFLTFFLVLRVLTD